MQFYNRIRVIAFVLIVICSSGWVNSSELLHGNLTDSQSQSFSFSVLPHVFHPATGVLYVAANQTVPSTTSFVIAKADRTGEFGEFPQNQGEDQKNSKGFSGIVENRIVLNGVKKRNPLLKNSINHLSLLADKVITVSSGAPATVFFMQDNQHLFSTERNPLKDTQGALANSVRALSSNNKSYIFAAVAPSGGFGQVGSGIALIHKRLRERVERLFEKDESGAITRERLKRTSLMVLEPAQAVTGQPQGNVPVTVDVSTEGLKIGSNLASLENAVVLHWDDWLQRLFIGVQGVGGAGATDGIRALVVGRLSPREGLKTAKRRGTRQTNLVSRLILDSVIPADAVTGSNQIVAARGASSAVSIHKLATMRTSTYLSYLIIAGGNGSPAATGATVYAVPLVDKNSDGKSSTFPYDSQQGALADYTSIPATYTVEGKVVGRGYSSPATSSSQVLTSTQAQALVGKGSLPLAAGQVVSDIVVAHDTVFASVSGSYESGAQPGIYGSQAIFDQHGRIANWTPWRRVSGNDVPVFGMAYDARTGIFWYLTGADSSSIHTVRRTLWSSGAADGLLGGTSTAVNTGLVSVVHKAFPLEEGGVHALIDVPSTSLGLSSVQRLSLLLVTGLKKVALIETARLVNGVLVPHKGNFSSAIQRYTAGSIATAPGAETKGIVLSGGALDQLGAIMAAQIATDGNQSWLFVGGVNGLGVLATEQGAGWQAGLQAGFANTSAGMRIKKIGDFKNVRALQADGTHLYVLTDKVCERINLTSSSFATDAFDRTVLASVDQTPFSDAVRFSDVGVSGRVVLLATSIGLYRGGNGTDVRTMSSDALAWKKVVLESGAGPVTRLFFVTPTGLDHDFAQQSNVYALSAYVGYHQAQVYRLYSNDQGVVSDDTITSLPDMIFNDLPIFFLDFSSYRNFIMTEGASLFNSRSRYQNKQAVMLGRVEQRAFANAYQNRLVPLDLKINTALRIANAQRCSGLGSILVPGDFGVRVLE